MFKFISEFQKEQFKMDQIKIFLLSVHPPRKFNVVESHLKVLMKSLKTDCNKAETALL